MRLAELAYEIAKDAIPFPSGFTLEGFVRGDYDGDRDFSVQISSLFYQINLAFARLVTERKTLLRIARAAPLGSGEIPFALGEVTAVADSIRPGEETYRFHPYGEAYGVAVEEAAIHMGEDGEPAELVIEYRPAIPRFSLRSIREEGASLADGKVEIKEREIELSDYGLTNEMLAYAEEFAKGGILEFLSPELSVRHAQAAESYFSRLRSHYTNFPKAHAGGRGGQGPWGRVR